METESIVGAFYAGEDGAGEDESEDEGGEKEETLRGCSSRTLGLKIDKKWCRLRGALSRVFLSFMASSFFLIMPPF